MRRTLTKSLTALILVLIFAVCGCVNPTQSQTQSSSGEPDVSAVAFNDKSTIYNGFVQSIAVTGLPEGITVEYENNAHKDAGEYEATATLYHGDKVLKTLTATLNIARRPAEVSIDDQSSMIDDIKELTYFANGVLAGDDLGLELTVNTNTSGLKEIKASYTNLNYDVTFNGGEYLITEYLFDSSNLKNYSSNFLPNYAPFALYDTSLFSQTVVTSISFPYYGLASGYTIESQNLYMPVYVVKSDFTTAQSQCTEENGKKINLDFTGKLAGVEPGDWLTVEGLNIEVGADETLAFGDSAMAVLPMFLRNNPTYGFWNRIFGSKGQNSHSLIFKIVGYSTKPESEQPVTPPDDNETYISFLGDSISTYAGWSNSTYYNNTIGSNAIWYPNTNYYGADLSVDKTWWHMTYTQMGYKLCVNNSWSGSVVYNSQTYNVRAKNLHNTTTNARPDVVVILIGVNDFAANTPVGNYVGTTAAPVNPTNFSEAYGRMLTNILETYTGVEVYCCTFLPDRKRTAGTNSAGINERAYNAAITSIATNLGLNVIDLYTESGFTTNNIGVYTTDNLHPNTAGMEIMKNVVVNALSN